MKKKKIYIRVILGIIFLGIIFTFYTTFSLEEDYTFQSEVYTIKDGYIENISPYTNIELFKEYFDLQNCTIKVIDENQKEITTEYIKNGSKTYLYNENKQVISTFTNIIAGDYNSDGIVNKIDLEEAGNNLVNHQEPTEIQTKSFDIIKDNKIKINDIVKLDNILTNSYQDLNLNQQNLLLQTNETKRIKATVTPNFGLDQNLNWTSENEQIATVSKSGIITGHQEGITTITATTKDGTHSKEIKVTVDNTIQLENYEGILYVGGKEGTVSIKAVDYEGITCTTNNEYSSCRIEGNKLILKALKDGITEITVTSPKYGSKIYTLTSYSTYLTLFPSYGCTTPNQLGNVIISSFHAGELIFDIKDKDIINDAYVESNRFYFKIGNKTGRGEVIIKELNGNKTKTFVLDVYRLSIPEIGQVIKIGEEYSINLIAEGTEKLTCTSPDEQIATCEIDGTTLKVQAHQKGEVQLNITNTINYQGQDNKCGETTFLAVVQEEQS